MKNYEWRPRDDGTRELIHVETGAVVAMEPFVIRHGSEETGTWLEHYGQEEAMKFLERAANEHTKLKEALTLARRTIEDLMSAHQRADKQWRGLNMLVAGEKHAYEIVQAANIEAEVVLRNTKEIAKPCA